MIPWFDASHLRIAGHDLPTQGPLAVAGIAVGQITFGRWLQRHLGLTPLQTDLFGFAAVAAGVVVGHIAAVLLTGAPEPLWQLAAPQSSLGALLGGGIVGALAIRRWKLHPLVVLDAAAWAFLHGWPLVRLGCVFAHDHPGRRSSWPIAVAFPEGGRLDIGLLEWLFCLALLVLARALMRRSPPPGRLAAWATLLFSAGRLGLELLRVDTLAQLRQPPAISALFACLCGLVLGAILWQRSRPMPDVAR